MRNKKIGIAVMVLQVFHQVDDLCLNRNIQRTQRLIANNKFGIQRNGPRDADPLALPTGKFVGIAVKMLRLQAAIAHHLQNVGPVLFLLAQSYVL